jgi:hypothetical protein
MKTLEATAVRFEVEIRAMVGMLLFPASSSCGGCYGSGRFPAAGRYARCSCREHETGECEPDGCSPECKRRAYLREVAFEMGVGIR